MNLDTPPPPREYATYGGSLHNPRLSTTANISSTANSDQVRPESVDLLQMVPEANRSRGAVQDYGLSRSLGRDCSPRLLLDDEDDPDDDDGLSICPHCKEEGIYYSRLEPPRDFNNARDATNAEDNSSVYFNYLGRNSSRTRMSESTTALYDRSRARQQKQQLLHQQGCCSTLPSQAGGGGVSSSQRSPAKRNNNAKPSNHDISYVTHTVMKSKSQRKAKIRKLLFLLCILVGILVALTGIIVGFAVLAPFNDSDTGCASAFVSCADRGCISLKKLCEGSVEPCADMPYEALCKTANTSSSKSHTYVTFHPNLEKPVLDERGWAYYSKGSQTGSKYKVLNKVMTFASAQEECRKLGGHLAHVNTMREQIYLEDFLRERLKEPELSRGGIGFWIGARRARGSHGGRCLYNQWKWEDAYGRQFGSIRGFTAFVPGKPDNIFSPEECLYMTYETPDSESYLRWDDTPCDLTTVGTIKVLCEVELK